MIRVKRRGAWSLAVGAVALGMLGAPAGASASTCTKTWTGATDSQWITPTNWSPSGVPGASDVVCIPTATPSVVLSAASTITELQNSGTLTVAAGESLEVTGVTQNNSGATLTVQGEDDCSGSSPSTLNTSEAFTNDGTLELEHTGSCTGGTVTLNAPGGLTNGGLIDVSAGPNLAAPAQISGPVTNQGTVRLDGDGLRLTSPFVQTAGTTAIAPTMNLDVSAGGVTLDGGTLTGSGTVTGSVNNSGGTVDPDVIPGTPLMVTGDYTQGPGGTLEIAFAGNESIQTLRGYLAAGGNVALAGSLSLSPSPNYAAVAALGDTVPILTYGGQRTGQFAIVTTTSPLAGGKSFQVTYVDESKLVNAVVLPPPPTISISAPVAGATYKRTQAVKAAYTCADGAGGPGIQSCAGTVPTGARINTSSTGPHTFSIAATSEDGLTTTATVHYTVILPSNRLGHSTAKVRRNGVIAIHLSLPGPGHAKVVARAGSSPIAHKLVVASRGGAISFKLIPTKRGRRLLTHHRQAIRIRVFVTYQPLGGVARTVRLPNATSA